MNNFIYISYFKEHSSDVFEKYIDEIFERICFLRKSYPGFKKWYYNVVVPEIKLGSREIILKKIEDEIVAVSILKKAEERKICTFIVLEQYQNQGIGKSLMEESLLYLETKNPMITVSSENLDKFKPILTRFGFQKEEELKGYYLSYSTEYVFNGHLSCRKIYKIA